MSKFLIILALPFFLIQNSCIKDGEGNKIARTKTCLNQLELMISEEISYEDLPKGLFSARILLDAIDSDSMASCLQDGWGRWFTIYHNVEEKSVKIWSSGPNGINDDGGNDDIAKNFKF